MTYSQGISVHGLDRTSGAQVHVRRPKVSRYHPARQSLLRRFRHHPAIQEPKQLYTGTQVESSPTPRARPEIRMTRDFETHPFGHPLFPNFEPALG